MGHPADSGLLRFVDLVLKRIEAACSGDLAIYEGLHCVSSVRHRDAVGVAVAGEVSIRKSVSDEGTTVHVIAVYVKTKCYLASRGGADDLDHLVRLNQAASRCSGTNHFIRCIDEVETRGEV